MIDENNRIEHRRENGINYVYEFLADDWIAIYENIDGLPLRPIIQACNVANADEYIYMREPVPAGTQLLIPKDWTED
jgi:hypothetical protein